MLAASRSSGQKRADFVQRLTYQPYGASPSGAYEIDRLVSEYNEKNIFSVIWEASQIRNSVEKWFSEALVMAKDMLIRWPGERIKIVRLLDDLLLMNTLLDRNKELFVSGSIVMNYLITKNHVDPPFYDQWKNRVQNLLTNLNRVDADISFVLDASEIHWESIEYAPPKRNFDPLTFFFIGI